MGLFDFFKKQNSKAPQPIAIAEELGIVYAPASGTVEPMAALPDPVFAGGAMGVALGVNPTEGVVYAPISGTVTVAMPHAIGITSPDLEILIHVGVDTVEMNGDGFELQIEKNQQVSAGDVLLVFDREKVTAAGYPDTVMAIVTNTADIESTGGSVKAAAFESVSAGEPFIRVTR